MSSKSDRTCPYCGWTFEEVAGLDAHVPCPENKGDKGKRRGEK